METGQSKFVILTGHTGRQYALAMETWRWMCAEYSFLISHAKEVDELPEGIAHPTPILDAHRRGIEP